jgi:hypothetical protein
VTQAARRVWQLQHWMLPGAWDGQERPREACKHSDAALHMGAVSHWRLAAALHVEAKAQQRKEDRLARRTGAGGDAERCAAAAADTALSAMEGRPAAACAACDTAAFAQLEQLYMLCYMLLTPSPSSPRAAAAKPVATAAIALTLPVSLPAGRLGTVTH